MTISSKSLGGHGPFGPPWLRLCLNFTVLNFLDYGWFSTDFKNLGLYHKISQSAHLWLIVLRSEIPSGMCAKLRTAAASNNKDAPQSLLLLLAVHIYYGVILHAHPVRGESHNQRNTTGEVATIVVWSECKRRGRNMSGSCEPWLCKKKTKRGRCQKLNIWDQGRTQGEGSGLKPPPWAWLFTKTLLPAQGRFIVSAYFLLVNLSS